jgi:hypothetical protein
MECAGVPCCKCSPRLIACSQGAELIFKRVIEPALQRYEGQIDGALNTGKRTAAGVYDETKVRCLLVLCWNACS